MSRRFPGSRRRLQSAALPRALALAAALSLPGGAPAPGGAQSPPSARPGVADSTSASGGDLQAQRARVTALLEAQEFAAADSAAVALVGRCEQERGVDAIETARAIELWARVHLAQGAYSDSTMLAAVERAVRIEEQDGTQHAELGDALELAGLLHHYAGNLPAARAAHERALRLHEQLYGPNHRDTGASLVNLGRTWSAAGDYAKARPYFERAAEVYERVFGPGTAEAINPLTLLARAQHDTGEYRLADATYARLTQAVERLGGPDDPRLIELLHARARNQIVGLQRPDLALPQLQRGLALAEGAHGSESPLLAKTLGSLGEAHTALGDPASALSHHRRAVALLDRGGKEPHPDLPAALNSLGSCLADLGEYDEARAVLAQALTLTRERFGPQHPNTGAALVNAGIAAYTMGDYELARRHFEQVLAIDEAKLGGSHPFVAEDLNNLAGILYLLGDLPAATARFERAVDIAQAALGPEHVDVGKWTTNLAGCVAATGDRARARDLFERGLRIQRKFPSANPVELAAGLVDYARVLADLGHTRDALQPLHDALATRREALGERHPDTARARQALGNVLAMLGDATAARDNLEAAAAGLEAALGPTHPDVGSAMRDLALLDLAQSEWAAAVEHASRAERIGRDHLRLTARGLSEREALAYASVRSAGCHLALAAALQPGQARWIWPAWDELVRSRALVLDEMAARRRLASASADPRVEALALRLQQTRTRLANLVSRRTTDGGSSSSGLLAAAQADKESAERELAAGIAPLAAQLARDRVGLAEVAAALPVGSALLAYARAASPTKQSLYCALLLPAGSRSPIAVPLAPVDQVDAAVQRWRRAIAQGAVPPGPMAAQAELACRAAGAELRTLLWDPVAHQLGGADLVFVVPDGTLHLVSFGALPVDGDAYLVERGPTLHLLTAERDLVAPSPASAPAGDLLAMGGPDFDAGLAGLATPRRGRLEVAATTYRGARSACAELGQLVFDPLPGAEQEVRALPRALRGASGIARTLVLTGRDATEDRFKRDSATARVVHVATHGFVLGGTCDAGTLAEIDAQAAQWAIHPGGDAPGDPSRENPLLRCGLAFAGANQRQQARGDQDDGILTAEEIASLDLSHAQWVVLSACDTGAGDLAAGEGVLGLRRAIQMAGASTVIHTLWQVDDALARKWVDELYLQRYRRGASTAAAVRAATLALLTELRRAGRTPHPFHWAAFAAAGSAD